MPDSGTGSRSSSPASMTRSPRISREDVQRRLAKKRSGSFESVRSLLVLDAVPGEREREKEEEESALVTDGDTPRVDKGKEREKERAGPSKTTPNKIPRVPPPSLSRMHPTYDGVLSIDPAPQPADPPRPSVPVRAASYQDTEAGGSPFAGSRSVNAYAMPSSASPVPTEGGTPQDKTSGKGKGVQLGNMQSALDRLMADVAGGAQLGADGKSVVGLKVEAVTEGVKAGQFGVPPGNMGRDDDDDVTMEVETGKDANEMHEDGGGREEHVPAPAPVIAPEDVPDLMDVDPPKPELHVNIPTASLSRIPVPPLTASLNAKSKGKEREVRSPLAITTTTAPTTTTSRLHPSYTSPSALSPTLAPLGATSLTRGPSVGTRDAIRKREELVMAKKREARRREAELYRDYAGVSEEDSEDEDNRPLSSLAQRTDVARPTRRRSRSTGDADQLLKKPVSHRRPENWTTGSGPLDAVPIEDEDAPLGDTMDRMWEHLGDGKVSNVRSVQRSTVMLTCLVMSQFVEIPRQGAQRDDICVCRHGHIFGSWAW